MKKIIVLSFLFAGFSSVGLSQEKKENQPERMKIYKVDIKPTSNTTNNSSENSKKFNSDEEEIAFCENQLKALDSKEEWIRQDPEEVRKAQESGWFQMAEKQRAELKARLTELNSQSK